MIPDSYYILDSLPKNQNGKIDRIQLKEQYLLEN
jgi:acyl-CoA synthetase (AMP-forming)/AMP-acid ligase II